MRALPQALVIIFEMQLERSIEKIARRKIKLFSSQNTIVFSSSHTSYFQSF
jgi:hypothetical protein